MPCDASTATPEDLSPTTAACGDSKTRRDTPEDCDPIQAACEVVISAKTGQIRQAGADTADGPQIQRWRDRAERDLYFFAKFVGNSPYLTPKLHGWLCRRLQDVQANAKGHRENRKMILIPRKHAKSRIVSQCLPPHILIQPKATNVYQPGKLGADTRILLCGENGTMIESQMRVVMSFFETNQVFRALWPHVIWPNPNRDAKLWNAKQFIINRATTFADPSVRALGADSTVTGSRTDVQILDDIISREAAESPAVMAKAISFYVSLKPLQEHYLQSLQFVLGTRWAPGDVYEYIETNEPDVAVYQRQVIENGHPIWPAKTVMIDGVPTPTGFSMQMIDALKRDTKELFWLNYMNQSTHGSLVDFNPNDLRFWAMAGDAFTFPDDPRDTALATQAGRPVEVEPPPAHLRRDKPMDAAAMTAMMRRDEYLRFKHA